MTERERFTSKRFGTLITGKFDKKRKSGGNVYVGIGLLEDVATRPHNVYAFAPSNTEPEYEPDYANDTVPF